MFLLGIDFETNGSDPKVCDPTEVGAVLYQYLWDHENDEQVIKKHFELSSLIYEPDYSPQPENIVELTGITDAMLKEKGQPTADVFVRLLYPLIEKANVIFAHKVGFDKRVLEFTAHRRGLPRLPDKEWICTLSNFPWPEKYTCKKLSHLAYDHGILVDPSTLHRASDDVNLMMRVIFEKYEVDQVLAYARKPFVYLRAFCIEPWKDGNVQTDIAKSLGFAWERVKYEDDLKFPKMWVQRVKADRVDDILKKVNESRSPFRVSAIEGVTK